MLPAAGLLSPARAVPLPLAPDDPAVAEQWVNPLLRPGESDEEVSLQLVGSEPAVVTPGETATVTLELHNHTGDVVTDLQLQTRRAEESTSTSQARQVLGYESGAYPWFGPGTRLSGDLAPGETRRVQLDIPTDPAAAETLSISTPGTYPVLFSLSGQPATQSPTQFSTERFLLNATGDTSSVPGSDMGQDAPAVPMTMLYPITAETDILPGETGDSPGDTPLLLRSEQLAGELAEGGRLDQLLQEYRQAVAGDEGAALQTASCLAVDPALLDTVDRMSRGYTVDTARQIEEPTSQRLRDSWTDPADPAPGTTGTGQQDAQSWLAELGDLAEETCVVALPWANADLDAVQQTGNLWLMRESLERGAATISEILKVDPVSNVVIPGSGYVSTATAPALGWADQSDATSATAASSGASGSGGTAESDPLEADWEQQAAAVASAAAGEGAAAERPGTDTLEDTTLPEISSTDLPAEPENPVDVLVADNTVWHPAQVDRFAELAPGVIGVTYQDSLAATLAATGEAPATVGYSNPDSRFDTSIDSPAARNLTAAASVQLAAAELSAAATARGDGAADPLFIMPPAHLSAATAGMLLDTARELLGDRQVTPLGFRDYLSPTPEQQDQLDNNRLTMPQEGTGFGAPFADPTVFSDAEILRTAQQANYIDDLTRIMGNDPAIVLTRYQFTAPLRRDLLVALSGTGRRSLHNFTDKVQQTDERLTGNRQTLQGLRSSVSLIPPGNVYTRASESSPLLIVAENRLPLPAQATIAYAAPEGAELNVPEEIRIPAMGSITLQMTADLPEDQDRTDLILRLATVDGAAISDPVEISVQTRAGLVGTSSAAIALVVALVLALVFRVGRHRKRRAVRYPGNPDAADQDPAAPKTTTGETDGSRPRTATPRRGVGHADENSGSPRPPGTE